MKKLSNQEYGNIELSMDYIKQFKIPKNSKILDIGCSYGSLIYNLHNEGYKNIYGVDIIPEFVNEGRNRYPTIASKIKLYDGEYLPFEDESFDVILMFDVIEHVPDIKDFMKNELYRVLKNGGLFIFQTPNKYTNIPWEIINQKSLTRYKKYHCSLQTKNSLKNILEYSNFRNIVIEKNIIITEHNRQKIEKKLGCLGIAALHLLQGMPLGLYPNFWGYCRR